MRLAVMRRWGFGERIGVGVVTMLVADRRAHRAKFHPQLDGPALTRACASIAFRHGDIVATAVALALWVGAQCVRDRSDADAGWRTQCRATATLARLAYVRRTLSARKHAGYFWLATG